MSLHCWYHSHIDLSHRLHSHPSNGARSSEVAKCLIKKWPCVNFQFQFRTRRIAYKPIYMTYEPWAMLIFGTNMSHHFRHVFIGSLTHNRSIRGGSIEESIEHARQDVKRQCECPGCKNICKFISRLKRLTSWSVILFTWCHVMDVHKCYAFCRLK